MAQNQPAILNEARNCAAVEALRQSEEKLRMALEAAQMGIWNWNLLTNQIDWSKGHEQLFGLEHGTFDGTYETFDALLHPDDRESLNHAVSRAIQERTDYQHEFRVIWPDGSVHWIEGKGKAFYNEAGQAVRMTGTVMNISPSKQAQEALQEQFERQRLVMEISQRIRQSLNLDEILNITVEEVRRFLHTDRAIVFRFDPDWKGTVLVESVGSEWIPILSTTIYDPCFGERYVEPFKQGLVTAKSDIYTVGIDQCHIDLLANFQVRANLVVPILQGENLWGLLIAHHCSAPRQWQQSEIDLLRQLATQVGIAIQQSTLFEQVQTELLERQRVEEALRQSEERFRVTLKDSPITVFNQDTELRYTWVYNPPAGFDAKALVGRYESEFLSFEDARRLAQIKYRVMERGIGTREETFIIIGGKVRYYDLTVEPLRSTDGEIVGVTCASMDISDRKRAEAQIRVLNAQLEQRVLERTAQLSQANQELTNEIASRKQAEAILREAERRWRYLLENVRLVVVGLDNTGNIEFVNSCFLQLTEYTQAEVLGKNWFEMFLPFQEQQQVHAVFQEVLKKEFHPHYQNVILTKSGQEKMIAWNNTPLRNLQSEAIGTMSIGEDITERYAIEKMKNEFISIVSHELRTPLTSIRGSLGLLATGALKNHPERMQRMIEIASMDTERLVRLVNDILDLERLDSGKVTLVKECCDAAVLIERSAQAMRALAQNESITLSVSLISALVWASSDHIIQALTNLLSNAIKFSPPNSTIALTAELQSDRVLFQVKDQGRGIPPDKLETIFERFQQVDSSDSRDKGGTGLGLAICRSIITQHEGQIWVESVLGEGSSFYFTLPVSSHPA